MEGQTDELAVLEARAAEAVAAFERARAARGGGGGGGGAGGAEQAVECNGCVMLFGRACDVKYQFSTCGKASQMKLTRDGVEYEAGTPGWFVFHHVGAQGHAGQREWRIDYPYAGGTQLPANWVTRLRAAGAIVGARAAGADN